MHGGLRYLQNFDLGLVREALLERQLMAALAPHLVRPLPFVVPAFDGARPDRLVGIGLNMYDVMAVDRRAPAPARAPRGARLEPRRATASIDGDEVLELLPALAARAADSAATCSTTARPTTSRLVLTVLGEAERFGAVCRPTGSRRSR